MEANFTKITYPIRYHVYVIIAYSLFVFAMNLLGNLQVNLIALTLVIGVNIAVFYSLNAVANSFFTYERPISMTMQLLLLIVAWYVAVYYLIYELFPGIGRKLFKTGGEFHLGKYIRNLTSYLEKSLLAVGIFQLSKLSRTRHVALVAEKEKTIVKERQLKVAAENKLILEHNKALIERENTKLRFRLQAAQLKSHWLHSVTMKLREKLAMGDDVLQLFDVYLAVLNYYYHHGGPDTALVTLREEHHLVGLFKLLNELLNEGKSTLIVTVNEPMIARQLPPFIITTLLENAFKFADQSNLDKPIALTINSLAKSLTITCWNMVDPERAKAAPKSGIGLHSIQQQLDYFAPGSHHIDIENNGISFEIKITIRY